MNRGAGLLLAFGIAACGRVGFDDVAREDAEGPGDARSADASPLVDAAPATCAGVADGAGCDDRNACTARSTCAAGVCLPDVAVSECDLADSMTGYADAQRVNGWTYGFYRVGDDPDGTYDAARDFRELELIDGAWRPGDYNAEFTWAYLVVWGGHPDDSPESSPIRRWTATTGGPAIARVHVAKSDSDCGNGIVGQLLVGGALAWSADLAFDDTAGASADVPITLEPGITVELALGARGDDGCDTSEQTLQILVR